MIAEISVLETFTQHQHSMFKLGTYFLCAFAAWNLWNGSSAEHHQSRTVCLLDDPKPNHCDSFCLNALQPVLNKIAKRQDQGSNRDAAVVSEGQAKLDRLVAKLEEQLRGLEAKMEGQRKAVETKMEDRFQAQIREVKAYLDGNQRVIQTQLDNVVKKVDAVIESNTAAKLDKLTAQQAKMEDDLRGVHTRIGDQVELESKRFEKQSKLERSVELIITMLDAQQKLIDETFTWIKNKLSSKLKPFSLHKSENL